MMLFIEIAQKKIMVLLRQTKGPPVLKIENIFKRRLLNHWSKFKKKIHRIIPDDAIYHKINAFATQNKMDAISLDNISLNDIS